MMATYLFSLPTLIDICRQNDVSMVAVFGSMIRGEAKKQSDIDLVVRFSKRKSLLASHTDVLAARKLSKGWLHDEDYRNSNVRIGAVLACSMCWFPLTCC